MEITENNWHAWPAEKVLAVLKSGPGGLNAAEVKLRLQKFGYNRLPAGRIDSLPAIFLRQFQSPLIYTLLAATAIIFALGEIIDGLVVLFVLFFNAVIGTVQEGRAQNTLLALKKITETTATVLRDNNELSVKDEIVVPGDVIILEAGQKVPADARILESQELKVDEASLTGESEPIAKITAALPDKSIPLPDRRNLLFKGTYVLSGDGRAVVYATGLKTEIGRIAEKISLVDTEIPLKRNIRHLSKVIVAVAAAVSLILIGLGLLAGRPLPELFITAVALTVSVIPEGLPIVMTLVLATGVWRMSKQNALVKRLQAVEALGQTKVVAVDKTGTLTRNEMVVQKIYIGGREFAVGGQGYEPRGIFTLAGQPINPPDEPALLELIRLAGLSARARLFYSAESKTWQIAGDPTEAALLVLAEKAGLNHHALKAAAAVVAELPFSHQTKFHAVLTAGAAGQQLTAVGAPEAVLKLCHHREPRQKLEAILRQLASEGFRVLAVAGRTITKPLTALQPEKLPPLDFLGFLAMRDALRPEVPAAVAKVESAGMRVVMITGDHALTATAIAAEAGIYRPGDQVLSGEELDRLSARQLAELLPRVSVFARVTPDHKMLIIQGYKARGEIVAMTGDGVNDAPSLVAADLGLAMGRIGTEVSKEAADIVLTDDNFGSIVAAVEEGRSIYKTIKKVILYLFATSAGEALAIIGAITLGYPLPILPAQIIWLNFVTDGFLDVSLAMEPKEAGLLAERPAGRPRLVDKLMAKRIVIMAAVMAIGTLFLFKDYFATDPVKAWTISLTTLAVFQWLNAWNCRSDRESIFRLSPWSNKFLLAATGLVIVLQLLAVYTPFFQRFLRTTALSLNEWIMIATVALSIVLVEEIRKLIYRWNDSRLGTLSSAG